MGAPAEARSELMFASCCRLGHLLSHSSSQGRGVLTHNPEPRPREWGRAQAAPAPACSPQGRPVPVGQDTSSLMGLFPTEDQGHNGRAGNMLPRGHEASGDTQVTCPFPDFPRTRVRVSMLVMEAGLSVPMVGRGGGEGERASGLTEPGLLSQAAPRWA